MENILEHCESDDDGFTSSNPLQQGTDENKLNDTFLTTSTDLSETIDSDNDDKDCDPVAKAIEDNLLDFSTESIEAATNGNNNGDDSATTAPVADTDAVASATDETNEKPETKPSTSSSPTFNEPPVVTAMDKSMPMSFDEDIILPTVRHPDPDPEQEQKQRDRIKRKELRSKREMEEEEREKMQ